MLHLDSGFQLRLGHSPRVIPPIVPNNLDPELKDTPEAIHAETIISKLKMDVDEAKDNLLQAKKFQTFFANKTRHADFAFTVGDKVMLSTLHRCQEYKSKGDDRVAKFFPQYDGPYIIIMHTRRLQTIRWNSLIHQTSFQPFTLLNWNHISQMTPSYFPHAKWLNRSQSWQIKDSKNISSRKS